MKARDKKGQVMVINLMFLVMTIMVLVGLIPAIREMLDMSKDQTSLNCVDNSRVCGYDTDVVPCYNNSSLASTSTVACLMIDLYLPYIVIVVLIMGVAKLLAQRTQDFFAGGQEQYYQ